MELLITQDIRDSTEQMVAAQPVPPAAEPEVKKLWGLPWGVYALAVIVVLGLAGRSGGGDSGESEPTGSIGASW